MSAGHNGVQRLVDVKGHLPRKPLIGCPHHPINNCISILIFGSNAHLPIEIKWMTGATALFALPSPSALYWPVNTCEINSYAISMT